MQIAVCVDDALGRTFNGRRQTKDRVVAADLIQEAQGRLFITPFSQKWLGDSPGVTLWDGEDPSHLLFLEAEPLAPYAQHITRLVIYRWNRHYPADTYLDLDPQALGLTLHSTQELTGFSHPVITKEIWTK